MTNTACRSDCKRKPSAARTSFDIAFEAATTSTAVALLLQPLQGRNRDEPSSSSAAGKPPAEAQQRIVKQAARIQQLEATIANKRKDTSQRGRGRGRGRGNRNVRGRGDGGGGEILSLSQSFATMTMKLPPGSPTGPPGDKICLGYNNGQCNKAVPGQKCPRGWRVCCKPGCQLAHTMVNHR